MRSVANVSFALAAGLVGGCFGGGPDENVFSSPLSGAIFTTLADGSRVDANIYDSKEDVYLDGGPAGGSPSKAAALPEGDYYFQVTDPSGKTLLSTDAIVCRGFRVNADGVISLVLEGPDDCEHLTGVDSDHGGITVQLMPYADTPNPGGEYKVWVTPVDNYDPDEGVHGFIHRYTKTDNFKVRKPAPFCGDGNLDEGEECEADEDCDKGETCSANCTCEAPPKEPFCGDGNVDEGEECEADEDCDKGESCSSKCKCEAPPPKEPCCGDGVKEGDEECDDGNLDDGDGCSSTCTIEAEKPECPAPEAVI